MFIGDEEIQIPVLIHIGYGRAIAAHGSLQTGADGYVSECMVGMLLEKPRRIAPTDDKYLSQAIIIEIGAESPQFQVLQSPRFQIPAQAGGDGLIPKRTPILVLNKKPVQVAKSCNIEIRGCITVYIAENNTITVIEFRQRIVPGR